MTAVDTFQSLAVILLAFLPGLLYVLAYEREVGAWGVNLADRLVRFLAASIVIQAVWSPGLWQAYRVLHRRLGSLQDAPALPAWVWPAAVGYVLVPILAGACVGLATKRGCSWSRVLTGPSPSPRAYDYLLARHKIGGWVRIKMKDGAWIIGAFADTDAGSQCLHSYASGYPEPEELFLAETAEHDGDGNFMLDSDGFPKLRGVGILVRLDEAAFLEWIDR